MLGAMAFLFSGFERGDAKSELSETVEGAVSRGMSENSRQSAFMAVEKLKYKVSEYRFHGLQAMDQALTGYALSDSENAEIMHTQRAEINETFNRYVWQDLRAVISDVSTFDFVTPDSRILAISASGFEQQDDVDVSFASLDTISRQLLFPVKNE